MCCFMNEKSQLLDLAAEISKKPSREECRLTGDPSYFPLAHPIKRRSAGFQRGPQEKRRPRQHWRQTPSRRWRKETPRRAGRGFPSRVEASEDTQDKPKKSSVQTHKRVTSNNLSVA